MKQLSVLVILALETPPLLLWEERPWFFECRELSPHIPEPGVAFVPGERTEEGTEKLYEAHGVATAL
jgi:hypothetical protein